MEKVHLAITHKDSQHHRQENHVQLKPGQQARFLDITTLAISIWRPSLAFTLDRVRVSFLQLGMTIGIEITTCGTRRVGWGLLEIHDRRDGGIGSGGIVCGRFGFAIEGVDVVDVNAGDGVGGAEFGLDRFGRETTFDITFDGVEARVVVDDFAAVDVGVSGGHGEGWASVIVLVEKGKWRRSYGSFDPSQDSP